MLLVMMLFYPFGYDQAVFSIGGEMVLKKGAIPFRDILDTKPPLIFYIYSIALFLFGHHDWSARAFDILYHFVAIFYFYKILVELLENEDHALIASFLYIILYTSSGYWMTAQAETFAFIPSVVIFYHTERFISRRGNIFTNAFAISLAITTLFFLKSTLLTVPAASLIYLIFRERNAKTTIFIASIALLTALSSGLYFYYLYSQNALGSMFDLFEWVQHYGDLSPLLAWRTISSVYLHYFPLHFLLSYSPTFIAAVLLSLFTVWRSKRNGNPLRKEQYIYIHFAAQIVLGLLAVTYERKLFPYHYSRIIWAMTPLITVGLIEIYNYIRLRRSSIQRIIIYCIVVLLMMPPLYRVASQPLRWGFVSLTGMSRSEIINNSKEYYPIKAMQELATIYSPKLSPTDEVFFWGNHIGVLFYLDRLPVTNVLTNTPVVTAWSPIKWRESMMIQLRKTSPKLFITERRDFKGFINGTDMDSW